MKVRLRTLSRWLSTCQLDADRQRRFGGYTLLSMSQYEASQLIAGIACPSCAVVLQSYEPRVAPAMSSADSTAVNPLLQSTQNWPSLTFVYWRVSFVAITLRILQGLPRVAKVPAVYNGNRGFLERVGWKTAPWSEVLSDTYWTGGGRMDLTRGRLRMVVRTHDS